MVDDELQVRDLLSALLKKEHCEVSTSSSGEEAIETVKNNDFDIVLMDIKMQGLNGIETLKQIKEIKPCLAVIMITGFGYDDELLAKAKKNGCSGYIGKNMPVKQIMESFKLLAVSATQKMKERGN